MAPFHPLRNGARAVLARAGAALAVFAAIAVVLLADGSQGPLTDAAAQKGKPGAEGVVVVDQGTEAAPVVEELPPPQKPPPLEKPPPAEEPPPVEEPPGQEPGSDDPSTDEPGNEDSEDDSPSPGDSAGDGGSDAGDGDSDAGQGDPGTNPADPPANRRRITGKPAGGSKGPDPTAGAPGAADEPAPVGLSPTLQASANSDSTAEAGDLSSAEPAEEVGDGEGALNDADSSDPGDPSTQELTARGGNSSDAGEDSDGAPGEDTGTGSGDSVDTTLGSGTELAAVPESGDSGGTGAGGGGNNAGEGDNGSSSGDDEGAVRIVTKTVDRIVNNVPDSVKAALAALAALSLLLGVGYLVAGMRARRLSKQRSDLLQEVGLLQSALLPPVPDKVGALRTSVAYRPADGPGAGGDFYDVLPLPGGRVGFILGDVSGHGRGALARTAFMRYTLRAYLEAGLEPRVALQVAGRVIDDNLGGDFATVLLAVHDPETGSLTYATAGHPAPLVVGPQPHEPVTAGSSPPIGVGVRTGLRQTTVPLVPGSVACLFTDGLMEARTPDGILGRERLAELLDELGEDASARRLIESVAAESSKLSDDMAAVIVSPTAGVTAGLFRTEQLELSARELEGPIARRFLVACGLSPHEVEDAEHDARLLAERFGGVVLHVVFGNRLRVEVLPRNVESIEAASRRVSAGTAR